MQLNAHIYLFATAIMLGNYGCESKHDKDITAKINDADVKKSCETTAGLRDEQLFRSFLNEFKRAVKNKDTGTINKLTCFPIHNLHPCYLPTEGETRYTDTTGIMPAVFGKLNKQVFDDETLWLADMPADSLYLYESKNDSKGLPLANIADHQTPIYTYNVVYAGEKTGGNKSLYFGRVKGLYKLIWIECDGNVNGH